MHESDLGIALLVGLSLSLGLSLGLGRAFGVVGREMLVMASIDFARVEASFEAAAHSYEQTAQVQQYMAQQLAQRIAQFPLEELFSVKSGEAMRRCRILEIGCGPGNFTQLLLRTLQQKVAAARAGVANGVSTPVWEIELVCNDLSKSMLQHTKAQLQPWLMLIPTEALCVEDVVVPSIAGAKSGDFDSVGAGVQATHAAQDVQVDQAERVMQAEHIPCLVVQSVHLVHGNILAAEVQARLQELGPFDLVVSNAVFQWFPQLTQALEQIRSYVRSQGYLAFSSFAQGTLAELKFLQGATHGLRYLTYPEIVQSLQEAKWLFLNYAQEQVQYHFTSAREVLRHLQHTGVNALGQGYLSVGEMRELLRRYEEHFRSEQGVVLSWCVYIALVSNEQ